MLVWTVGQSETFKELLEHLLLRPTKLPWQRQGSMVAMIAYELVKSHPS